MGRRDESRPCAAAVEEGEEAHRSCEPQKPAAVAIAIGTDKSRLPFQDRSLMRLLSRWKEGEGCRVYSVSSGYLPHNLLRTTDDHVTWRVTARGVAVAVAAAGCSVEGVEWRR